MTILHNGHRRHSLLSPQRSRHTRMVVLVGVSPDGGETSPLALLVQHRLQQLPVADRGPHPRRFRIRNIFSGFTKVGSVGTILDTIFTSIFVLNFISNFRICFKILRSTSLVVGDRIQAIVRVSGGLRDEVRMARGQQHGQLQHRHGGGGGAEAGRHLKLGLRALLLPSAGAVPDNAMIFCGFSQLRPIHQSNKEINCLMQLIFVHRAPNYESSPIINPSEANNNRNKI